MGAPSGACPIVVTKNFQKESFSLVPVLRMQYYMEKTWQPVYKEYTANSFSSPDCTPSLDQQQGYPSGGPVGGLLFLEADPSWSLNSSQPH